MVRVKATLSVAISNVTVHFMPFDVDDPWTNAAPIDADPNATDNRSDVALSKFTAVTDADGVASNLFAVSPQPGNNYRIVASCESAFPGQFSVVAPSTNGALTNATLNLLVNETNFVTPMLTVWRSVHMEQDTMSAVAANTVTGFITRVNGLIGGPLVGATQAILSVNLETSLGDISRNLDGTNAATLGNGRFENGQITIGTLLLPATTINLLGNGDMYVDTKLVPSLQFLNIPFTISNGVNTASGMVTRMVPSGGGQTFVGVNTALTRLNPALVQWWENLYRWSRVQRDSEFSEHRSNTRNQ